MHISVERAGRRVRQHGHSLGELEGCVIEEVSPQTLAAIQAALPAHGGGVRLSADHATVDALPAPEATRAVREAHDARAAAVAQARELTARHPDPLIQILARLVLGEGA